MPDRMTGTYDRVEVITSVQRRRRWTPEEKIRIVEETYLPGNSVSLVARQHGLAGNQRITVRSDTASCLAISRGPSPRARRNSRRTSIRILIWDFAAAIVSNAPLAKDRMLPHLAPERKRDACGDRFLRKT